MAVKTNFYINGAIVNPPKNWQEMEIELNFDKDKETTKQQLSISNWEFVRENSDFLNTWLNDGTTNGVGLFEGIPFKIEIDRNGTIEKPFDGYLDLSDGTLFSQNRTTVVAKERQKIDWLNDVADSFTFEYLFKETGEITNDDFVFIPYIINSVPDYKEAAISYISMFFVAQQIDSVITELAKLAAEMANPFEATAIIRTILYIVYLVVLIISLIKLIKDIVLLIIQPVKYHAAMSVKTMLERGATHLGLTFKSDIFETDPYDDLYIIPEKLSNPINDSEKRILGFTLPTKTKQEGYFKGTYGQLLRAMKSMFNAKIIITDNKELFLIRQDENISNPQYQLADIYQPYFETNADEFKANYYIKYLTDISDKNTIQEYGGTSYQLILKPVRVNNPDLVLMKGIEQVVIPFALAKRKEELTVPEQIVELFLDTISSLLNGIVTSVNAVIKVYNVIINKLNKIIKTLGTLGIKVSFQISPINPIQPFNLGQIITNRIGMMKVETDHFNVAKILTLDVASNPKNTKIKSDNINLISAQTLYNNFHFVNSFFPTVDNPTGNQRIIKNYENVPFTFSDYLKVKDNNIIYDSSLQEAEIVSLRWNPYGQKANMSVRFPKLLTNNFIKTELIADGK